MPNWCSNILTVNGSTDEMRRFDANFRGRPPLWPPSQHELKNKTEDEIEKIQAEERKEWENNLPKRCLNALYPVPEEVLKVGYSVQSETLSALERLDSLIMKDKWIDGYTWCVSHWGTKWDVYGNVVKSIVDITVPNELTYVYDFPTAWSPPIPWTEKVAADYPTLSFRLAYCEEGACFAGEVKFDGGRRTHIRERDDDGWIDFAKQLGFDIEPEGDD